MPLSPLHGYLEPLFGKPKSQVMAYNLLKRRRLRVGRNDIACNTLA